MSKPVDNKASNPESRTRFRAHQARMQHHLNSTITYSEGPYSTRYCASDIRAARYAVRRYG